MFNALNPDELEIVLGAMQKVVKNPDEMVITQGDDGDVLYVIESGTLSCFKVKEDGGELPLKEYQPGEAFGELALLYNAPRAASIRAKTDA